MRSWDRGSWDRGSWGSEVGQREADRERWGGGSVMPVMGEVR